MSAAAGLEYLFLTCAYLVKLGEQTTSFGASARLGSIAPARALGRLGYDARAYSAMGDIALLEEATRSAKRIVFGEMWETKGEGWAPAVAVYRRLLAQVGDPRRRVIFSIADDHFDHPDFLAFYREALPGCLAVTVASATLADTVKKLTARPVLVAPEPVEGLRGAPHAIAARRLRRPVAWLARRVGLSLDHWRVRLLWYGYAQNLPPLLELIPALEAYARQYPVLLTCVTSPAAEIAQLMTPARTRDDSRLRTHFVPWSPVVMDLVIEQSDLVLIPRAPGRPAKSPNRLVAGLHGGRFVVAQPLPAYAPYQDFAWIGEDLVAGIDWAIRHPREVVERIARGQSFIDERHSPEAVASFWLDVFDMKN
jgi:hypothetical protein